MADHRRDPGQRSKELETAEHWNATRAGCRMAPGSQWLMAGLRGPLPGRRLTVFSLTQKWPCVGAD